MSSIDPSTIESVGAPKALAVKRRWGRRRWMIAVGSALSIAGVFAAWVTPKRVRELWLGSWLHKRYVAMTLAPYSIRSDDVIEAFRAARVDVVATVPDFVQLSVHARLERGIPGISLVRCCTEEQAVNVAAGLAVGGKRTAIMIQNQGLYACVNAIRAIGLDARIPLVLVVGQFGREFSNLGSDPRQSRRRMVRLVEPLLEALEIPVVRLERHDDAGQIPEAFRLAAMRDGPVAVMVGAYTT